MVVVPQMSGRIGWSQECRSLFLVDRRPLFLAAVAALIKEACPQTTIEVFTESDRALAAALERPVDVLLCETRAVPFAGAEVAARIDQVGLRTRVILLGDQEDQELLVASLGCGAVGFFTKDATAEELTEGLEAVLAGHFVIGRDLLHPILARLSSKGRLDHEASFAQLSETERSILVMLGRAQSTQAIAASRGISPKTVRNHLASIYRKLSVRNRTEAILWSARAGLVEVATDPEERAEV